MKVKVMRIPAFLWFISCLRLFIGLGFLGSSCAVFGGLGLGWVALGCVGWCWVVLDWRGLWGLDRARSSLVLLTFTRGTIPRTGLGVCVKTCPNFWFLVGGCYIVVVLEKDLWQ